MRLLSLVIFLISFTAKAQYTGPVRFYFDEFPDREDVLIYTPENPIQKNIEQKRDQALILSLHGLASSPYFQNKILDLKNFVGPYNFILALPIGQIGGLGRKYWNATDFCCGRGYGAKDDVAYLTQLIEKLIDIYPIDRKKIFIIGHSNGGFMAHRLACERSDLISGIVSFAGSNFKDLTKCLNKSPISVLQIHGTMDELVRYEGTEMYPGAKETISYWGQQNSCEKNYTNGPDMVLGKIGNQIRSYPIKTEYLNHCIDGKKVSLWTIQGGGHIHQFDQPILEGILDFLFK